MAPKHTLYLNVLLVVCSIGITLLLCEMSLRLVYGSASEKLLDYRDTWRPVDPGDADFGPGGFLKEDFEGEVQDGFGGKVRWKNNSQGFRSDVDFTVPTSPRSPHTYRILSLGDSFTAGYRVDQSDTFSALTETVLAEQHPEVNIEVMVSVIEDPALGLLYLQKHGLRFKPDLVILGITLANDIQQAFYRLRFTLNFIPETSEISLRGNAIKHDAPQRNRLETMKLPSKCVTNEERLSSSLLPSALEVYSLNEGYGSTWIHDLRLVQLISASYQNMFLGEAQTVVSDTDSYDEPLLWESHGLALFLKEGPPEVEHAYNDLFSLLEGYSQTTSAHGIHFMAVIFPQRYQVREIDWLETKRVYRLKEECFDLHRPNDLIMSFCAQIGINCIDPIDRFRAVHKPLYLPRHDMHWNADGHAVLAQVLVPEVQSVMQPSGAVDKLSKPPSH